MGNVTTIGLDLAKSVFQVHGVDTDGAGTGESGGKRSFRFAGRFD